MSLGPGAPSSFASRGGPIDARGAFGIRPEPAAAILRRRGGQTRRAPGRGRVWRSTKALSWEAGVGGLEFFRKRRRLAAGSSFGILPKAANCRVVGERLKSTQSGPDSSAQSVGRVA